jgi:hypothetical protein
MSVRRRITIIIITHAIKLNFIDRLQFVFWCHFYVHILFFCLFRTCLFHCYALTTKALNVSDYTSSSSNVCVCVCMFTQMGKDRFLFSSSSSFFFVYTSPNNRRRLLLERRVTLLKYLVLQYINRVLKRAKERKELGEEQLE